MRKLGTNFALVSVGRAAPGLPNGSPQNEGVKVKQYEEFDGLTGGRVKAWVKGVPFGENTKDQLRKIASLPFIHQWVAAMPDVHLGIGATVGSVIATKKAIVPAAVGVDIGCGMIAVRTSLKAEDLPDDLKPLRAQIERSVPHGKSGRGGRTTKGLSEILPNAQKTLGRSSAGDTRKSLASTLSWTEEPPSDKSEL